MAILATNAVQIARFANALYGVQLGSATNAAVLADITAAGGLDNALNSYYASSFGSKTSAQVAAVMVANLGIVAGSNGLTAAAVTDATNYIVATLNAAPAAGKGAAVKSILNLWANIADDATLASTYGAAATAWNANVAAAQAYTASNTADAAVGAVVSGQTFTLTTGVDNINGTANSDTIIGDANTASVADQINGGAGTDTLRLVSTTTKPAAITNVENLMLDSTAGDSAFDASTITGVTSVTLIRHTTDATNANAKPTTLTLAADQALTLDNVAAGDSDAGFVQVKYASSVTSSTVALAKAGDAATSGVALTIDLDGTAVTTLNLSTSGTASRVIFNDADSDNALATINVTGDKNLTATIAASSATKQTIAAGAFTGNLNLDLSATENFEATGGSGNDRFNFGSALTTSDKVNGGAGTDTLATSTATVDATFAATVDSKTNGVSNISSVEVLEFTGTGAYSLDASVIQMASLTTYSTTGAIAPAQATGGTTAGTVGMTVTGQKNAQTFSIEANVTGGAGSANTATNANSGAGATGVTFAPSVNNGDNTLNLSLKGVTITGGAAGTSANAATTATGASGGNAADFSNFETINITSTGATATAVNTFTGGAGAAAVSSGAGAGAAGSTVVVSANAKIYISGANEINLGAINSSNQPVTVDATALTGKMTVASGTAADVVKGGAGVNVITLGGGVDTVNLGLSAAKADTVAISAATNTTSAAFVSITGFTSAATTGDKLDLNGTPTIQADVSAGTATGVANLTASVSSGIMSFAGSAAATATLANKVAAAVSSSFAGAQNETVAFEHNGNTYIVHQTDANANAFNDGADSVIELVGVTGITALSTSASAANTLFIG